MSSLAQFHIKMGLRSLELGHHCMDKADNCLKTLDFSDYRQQLAAAEKHGKSAEYHIQKMIMAHQQVEKAKM